MNKTELHRLEPTKDAGFLEILEAGYNGGLFTIEYVAQKYGGGKYVFRDQNGYKAAFEISGLPRPRHSLECVCDISTLMARGCQCKGV